MVSQTTLREYERIRAWAILIIYAGLMVYMSHQPIRPDYHPPFANFDKFVHILEYAVLAVFLQRALATQAIVIPRLYWITFIACSVFGITDEIHQYFVPTRSCDILDWLADLVGIILGILLYKTTRPRHLRTDPELLGEDRP